MSGETLTLPGQGAIPMPADGQTRRVRLAYGGPDEVRIIIVKSDGKGGLSPAAVGRIKAGRYLPAQTAP